MWLHNQPRYIDKVQEHPISGWDKENPYHHLREFEQVCSCLKISGMTHEALKWKLFPFSLIESAKQRYTTNVRSANEDWNLSRILSNNLQAEILTFRKNEKESISAAWDKLSSLVQSSPNLSLPNHFFNISTRSWVRTKHTTSISPQEDLLHTRLQPKEGKS
jgi:hypothetical protein